MKSRTLTVLALAAGLFAAGQAFAQQQPAPEQCRAHHHHRETRQLHNGANQFGDVALDMQVSVPSAVLGSWFIRRSRDRLKQDSMSMSLALQAKLRTLLPFCYFQDVSKLLSNPAAAALLVWAAMPVSTTIDFQDGQIRRFNTDSDVYWNFVDTDLRRAVAYIRDHWQRRYGLVTVG